MRKAAFFLLFSAVGLAQTGSAPAKQQDDQPSQTAKPNTGRSKKAPANTKRTQNPAEPNAMPVDPKTPIEPTAPRTPVSPDNPTKSRKSSDPTKPTTVNPPLSK